jgi:hypothetical protein
MKVFIREKILFIKRAWARWDLNPGPLPCKGSVLTRLDDGPLIIS